MAILVVAELINGKITPATLSTVTAAGKIGGDIHVLFAGPGSELESVQGVAKSLKCDDAELCHGMPENTANLIAKIVKAGGYSHVLAPATSFGKNVLPRAAALCDAQQISDIISVESADTFKRPIYAGNAIATVQSADAVKFITVRATAFDKAAIGGSAAIETVEGTGDAGLASFSSAELSKSERPELTAARVVISGGRGFGSGDNFKMIEALADKLGAAIGASRAAVDAGYVPSDYQVGQTGKVVAPDLYIAVGISGAIQHLAGMKESKVIVAINKDPEAPIFGIADYGLVADLFTALPELTAKL